MQKASILAALFVAMCVYVPAGMAAEEKGIKDIVEIPGSSGEITTQNFTGYDSDRDNDEVVWYKNESTYGGPVANARSAWNGLDRRFGGRGVIFRPISEAPSGTDVELVFDDRASCGAYAYFTAEPNPDKISFCRNNMRTLGGLRRDEVGAHEAGHAIGLAHPEPCRRYLGRSIMVGACGFSDSRKPLRHDVRDYERLWVE